MLLFFKSKMFLPQVTTKDWIHLTKPETTGIDPYDLESREKLKDPKERRTNEFAGM